MVEKQKTERVPVSERALVQRINRKLSKQGEMLRKSRGGSAFNTLGDFYSIDIRSNSVASHSIDIEVWGRELAVLHPWEKLED